MLKESLENFTAPNYGKTFRTPATYKTVADYRAQNLLNLIQKYHAVKNDQQLLREIRNDIDYNLRRYHEYCIKQRDGMQAHYHEVGAAEDCDFEHLIPAARIRDLLLADIISVEQALNAPTVRLSRLKHSQLKDAGWASHTPNMWLPFRRYSNVFEATYTTYDGSAIDPETWTLEDHYNYFKHLVL
jgi:uncharacterized protein YfbU (UPF0304 family)